MLRRAFSPVKVFRTSDSYQAICVRQLTEDSDFIAVFEAVTSCHVLNCFASRTSSARPFDAKSSSLKSWWRRDVPIFRFEKRTNDGAHLYNYMRLSDDR
mmetsp:Transcript_5149/g.19963  ORF Transcript_5149/g.19963 Transcript_5149/m.19963 type:complete len:99 (-) Transcript_5149:1503-1799(-)